MKYWVKMLTLLANFTDVGVIVSVGWTGKRNPINPWKSHILSRTMQDFKSADYFLEVLNDLIQCPNL